MNEGIDITIRHEYDKKSAMKKAELKTMGNFADEPWSPELYRAVRTLTVWKVILSQYKTRLWFE